MGKRIRWIWVISLSAALAAIGVQGYWLFNQFRYEMCTYADEIAGEVFHAGQEEFRIRKEEAEMTKGTYIVERQSKYQSGDSVLNGLKNSFGFQLYPKDTTKIHSFRLHLDPNMPEVPGKVSWWRAYAGSSGRTVIGSPLLNHRIWHSIPISRKKDWKWAGHR